MICGATHLSRMYIALHTAGAIAAECPAHALSQVPSPQASCEVEI